MSEARQLQRLLEAWLDEAGVEWERGVRQGEVVVTLPGEHKLRTVCSLVAGRDTLSVSAFVVRQPDENHEAVYRFLLRRNLRMPLLAYAVDEVGDIYVAGRVPVAATDPAYVGSVVDDVLGVVLDACDGAFDELLVRGFLSSMRREWAWRVSRGLPTRNLEAFRSLLEHPPAEDEGGPSRQ